MNIAFLLFSRALATGITLPAEMLTSASVLRSRNEQKNQPLQIDIIASSLEPITVTGGISITPTALIGDKKWDLIVIPPMWGNPTPVLAKLSTMIDWLTTQASQSKIIAIGTGATLLAETGCLNGQLATTHWYYFAQFEAKYPDIKLQRKAFITAANNLYCAGSINSAAELMLWFIKLWWGETICSVIEKHYGHEISRTYDQPFFIVGGEQQYDEDIAFAQNWMATHYHQPITAQTIADATDMSLRSFNRRFKAALGITPLSYLQNLRLNAARELLKDFNLGIEDVSLAVGYKDSAYFSRLFAKHMDMTATEYRNLVRAKLFSA